MAIAAGMITGTLLYFLAWRRLQGQWVMRTGGLLFRLQALLSGGLMAVLFVSLVWRFGISWQMLKFAVLGSILVLVALIDYHSFLIPDRLLVTGLLAYIPLNLLCGVSLDHTLVQGLLGGWSVAVPLLLVVLAADAVMQQETMGGGDIKLFFLLGVYLGPLLTVFTLFAACALGLAGQLAQQKLEPGKAFPFGPFIALAVWPVLLWGTSLAQWYLQLL